MPEEKLKAARPGLAFALALVFCFGVCVPDWASAAGELLVGVVRDQNGNALAGARVSFALPDGREAEGTSAEDGTFALDSPGDGAGRIAVRCAYCAPYSVAATPGSPVLVIVRRYVAVLSERLDAADFMASPFRRPAASAALRAYTFASADRLSDRGLNGGQGLTLSSNAPAYGITGGSGGLATLPDRYLARVAERPASDALRYGTLAAGGTFALRAFDDPGTFAQAVTGYGTSWRAGTYGGAGGVAAGASDADGVVRRRVDAEAGVAFEGGRLTADASAAGSVIRSEDAATLSYATASWRYETYGYIGAWRSAGAPYGEVDASSTFAAGLRVRNRTPVRLEFGGDVRRSSGRVLPAGSPYEYGGYQREERAFGGAQFSGRRVRARVSVEALHAGRATQGAAVPSTVALLPGLEIETRLGAGWSFEAAGRLTARTPTILEDAVAQRRGGALGLARYGTVSGALRYTDAMRVSAELTVYRQRAGSQAAGTLTGEGASVRWQIAPLVALRAWTIRIERTAIADDAPPYGYASFFAEPYTTLATHRDVVWLTAQPGSFRLDAIYADARIHGAFSARIADGIAVFAATEEEARRRSLSAGMRFTR